MQEEFITVFSKESCTEKHYRNPAIIKTKSGVLVACCDMRKYGQSDFPNRIDKVIRRSEDGGITWQEKILAVEEKGTQKNYSSVAIGSCMLYDEKRNTIFIFYTHMPAGCDKDNCQKAIGEDRSGNKFLTRDLVRGTQEFTLRRGKIYYDENDIGLLVDEQGNVSKNGQKVCNIHTQDGVINEIQTAYLCVVKSFDEGKTWSLPQPLNYQVKDSYMSFISVGGSRGIKLTKGEHKGRFIVPIYYNTGKGLVKKFSSAIIYSDDNGVTWKRGKSPNECRKRCGLKLNRKIMFKSESLSDCQVIETEDGTIKMFMRNFTTNNCLSVATSKDGGITWTDYKLRKDLPCGACGFSIINCKIEGKDAIVFVNPADEDLCRNCLVRVSFDGAISFQRQVLFKKDGFFNSSIVQLEDESLGIIFEPSVMFNKIFYGVMPIQSLIEN